MATQLVPVKETTEAPEENAKLLAGLFEKIGGDLEAAIPRAKQLFYDFAHLKKGQLIMECSTQDEWAQRYAKRTARALRYMFEGGNPGAHANGPKELPVDRTKNRTERVSVSRKQLPGFSNVSPFVPIPEKLLTRSLESRQETCSVPQSGAAGTSADRKPSDVLLPIKTTGEVQQISSCPHCEKLKTEVAQLRRQLEEAKPNLLTVKPVDEVYWKRLVAQKDREIEQLKKELQSYSVLELN